MVEGEKVWPLSSNVMQAIVDSRDNYVCPLQRAEIEQS